MKQKLHKAYYIIPIVYCCLTAFFFYLHFFSYETVTKKAGSITVEVRSPSGKNNRQKQITEFSLDIEPFSITFSKKTPLTVELENGEKRKLGVQDYSIKENSIDIIFSEDLVLNITEKENSAPEIEFSLSFARTINENAIIDIPFSIYEGATIAASDRIPVMAVSNQNKNAFIIISGGSEIRTDVSRIVLPLEVNTETSFSLVFSDEQVTDPLAYWFSQDAISISRETYEAKIAEYISKAYEGWNNTRFEPNTGTWVSGNGELDFSEEICISVLAESLVRGEFMELLPKFQQAARKNLKRLTYISNSFYGNIPRTTNTYFDEVKEKLETYGNMISSGNPEIAAEPGITDFLAANGTEDRINEFSRLLSTVNMNEADINVCLGTAAGVFTMNALGFPDIKTVEEIEKMIETRILPRIMQTDIGILLESAPGEADTMLTLRGGLVLQEAGKAADSDIFLALGRSLIYSVLSQSDETGFLPQKTVIQNNEIKEIRTEAIEPEVLYPLLRKNPFYPRETLLHNEISFGSWIRTCASVESFSINDEECIIRFRFPVDGIHHCILQGLPPFKGVQLFGINWVSDPSFERYTSGWVYQKDTNTFFLKLKHKTELEEIKILF